MLTPILVRPDGDGYEIVSGHRRIYACTKAGIEKVPALIFLMDRDRAAISLVDSNMHRDGLLPSEKAFAYKLKADAMKHQGKTYGQVGQKLTRDEISDTESGRTVQRYIRLTHLIKQLLELVDQGRIAMGPAVELSYLSKDSQTVLAAIYADEEITPSYSQAVRMRRISEQGVLSSSDILRIMEEPKANQKEYLRLSEEQYGPYLKKFQTPREKEAFILKALDYYTRHLERLRDRDR